MNWAHDDFLFEEEMKKLPKRARKDLLTQLTVEMLCDLVKKGSKKQLRDTPGPPVKK